jgi:XTP/dITP diphosphohydrolase
MDILLASQNPGKLAEMRYLVWGLPFQVVGPRDVGIHDAPEETGTTFAENAREKARHYARLSGLLAIADDSGLSVDAMSAELGVYSARFGGPGANDDDRNRLILERLADVAEEKRTARFTCALAVARGDEIVFETLQIVEGLIARAPRGPNGFGYDPIFFFPAFGRTFGEVAPEEKETVSHRGKAFREIRRFLATVAGSPTAFPS